jgi:hypothetical protein
MEHMAEVVIGPIDSRGGCGLLFLWRRGVADELNEPLAVVHGIVKQHTLLINHHHVESHLAAPDAVRARAGVDDRCERRLLALGSIARFSVARGVLLAPWAATMALPTVFCRAHTVGVTYLKQGGGE